LFEKTCKDDFLKEGLVGASTANKIIFRLNESSQGYQQLLFENGALVIQCKVDRFWTNINDIGNFKIETIIPSDDLPFVLKKNIRDAQPKLQQNLARIKNVTGIDFTYEVDFAAVLSKVAEYQSAAYSRLGEIMYDSYLNSIASLFEKSCKDDMVKSALLESLSSNSIIFRIHDAAKGYQEVLIENGSLIIQCVPSRFWTNVQDIGNFKIETIIPSSDIPFIIKKNIRDNDAKLKAHLEKIKAATGNDFVFETDYQEVLTKVVEYQNAAKERLGEILLDGYMSKIADLFDNKCKDDLIKGGILRATTANKIVFRINEDAEGYQDIIFADGAMIVQCKASRFWTNLNDIPNAKIEAKLT